MSSFVSEFVTGASKVVALAAFCVGIVGLVAYLLTRDYGKRKQAANNRTKASTREPRLVEAISFAEVRSEHDRRKAKVDEWSARIANRLAALQSRSLETSPAEVILDRGTPNERANALSIIAIPPSSTASVAVLAIRQAGSHSAAAALRKARGLAPYVEYEDVVRDVAIKLGAPPPAEIATVAAVERSAIEAAFNRMLAKATPDQRKTFEAEIARAQAKSATGIVAAGSVLAMAHLSGFGLYMAASSVLAGITGALHITLPFAVYMGMSSTLAVIIGPVGWLALAAAGIAKFGAANYKKTVPAVLAIATIRSRLIAERDQEISALMSERDTELAGGLATVVELERILERMEQGGLRAISKEELPKL